jgi:Ion channel
MLVQLLIGGVTSVCNIVIHALIMLVVIRLARSQAAKMVVSRWYLVKTMVTTATVLMVAHMLEVMVWAGVYGLAGAAPPDTDLLYFAFVNYTTLGYGDIIPLQGRTLLGPFAAMNGIFCFGWSTAVLFEVLRRALQHMDESVREDQTRANG